MKTKLQKFFDERDAKIIADLLAGKSVAKIALREGVTKARIYQIGHSCPDWITAKEKARGWPPCLPHRSRGGSEDRGGGMTTIYVHFNIPSGRKIMYVSTVKTLFPVGGPALFEATTTEELVNLSDKHQPAAVDFADSRFPRHATPIYKAISDHMFSKYVRLINVHHRD